MNIEIFKNLAAIYDRHGFNLYMIGGTSRDYLLGIDSFDYDLILGRKNSVFRANPKELLKKIYTLNFARQRIKSYF